MFANLRVPTFFILMRESLPHGPAFGYGGPRSVVLSEAVSGMRVGEH